MREENPAPPRVSESRVPEKVREPVLGEMWQWAVEMPPRRASVMGRQGVKGGYIVVIHILSSLVRGDGRGIEELGGGMEGSFVEDDGSAIRGEDAPV